MLDSHRLTRRRFLQSSPAMGAALIAGIGRVQAADAGKITWHDVKNSGVEGKGWSQTKRFYDRLPAKAEGVVRGAVWNLSRHSAGMCVDFETDATTITAKWSLLSRNLSMPHMPATGVSGIDLYAQEDGKWYWLAVGMPRGQTNQATLVSGIKPGKRRYRIYLPLYNGTESLAIGINQAAQFKLIKPRADKPLLFYGTSITHGACASRPGMPHPAILGRWFDKPVINLGFSGNGKMEKEVAALLGELDPCLYVIDCLPNMNGPLVAQRAAPLVRILRKARPTTPILLVEDRSFTNARFLPARQQHHAASRAALKNAFATLQKEGVKDLHCLEGADLLGNDGEAATDGSHPNDLGFMRQAKVMAGVLKKLL